MDRKTAEFEAARPHLTGLAYRLLGSVSDAQDAVQDTFLKWMTYPEPVESPPAWFTRVCTNRCLDMLKSARHQRVDYIGPWIPDQLQTEFEPGAEQQLELSSSLTTAFLLLLERLTPKERAAYLLHDIFAMPFQEIAEVLDLKPANCRKLAARARSLVTQSTVRHAPSQARQAELLNAFETALQTGDTADLGALLRADADLRADSGGRVQAVRDVLTGQNAICAFVKTVLIHAWAGMRITRQSVNGSLALILHEGAALHATVSFGCDAQGNIAQIYILRHPDKLRQLGATKTSLSQSGGMQLQ
ncbi:RNA polymerase sigma factor SigJ [Leisingera sp. ANG-M1]|uniref:RNA polymerase sigma factor SigJ n=1 Tax=Leisingera sp. ANG-M1 TaxID=1577895 RepID=UPI000AD7CA58|nr:RNA polymerase sigma factor SigJ [Leisingera sp. ANG-M1]